MKLEELAISWTITHVMKVNAPWIIGHGRYFAEYEKIRRMTILIDEKRAIYMMISIISISSQAWQKTYN